MTNPIQVLHRDNRADAVIVFLHGFSAKAKTTWGQFPEFLKQDARLNGWDIYGLGYPSSLRVDVPGLWEADPGLDILAKSFCTALSLAPFADYKAIALAAHSMGGLIAQRALLDDPKLTARLSHLFLFGTPSNGLVKAWLAQLFKPQLKDMTAGSAFITKLRADWTKSFEPSRKFAFVAAAGDRDEFVPPQSSIGPFPHSSVVVPGNHLEIVKPEKPNRSVALVVQGLTGKKDAPDAVDSARLAIEQNRFHDVINSLAPLAENKKLDDAALVTLALAYEGVGDGAKALALLEKQYKNGISSTDALGVLGGRIKRRWLLSRDADDLKRARALYSDALAAAEKANDHEQAFYHAINVAFLDLYSSPENSKPSPAIIEMARRAIKHCKDSQADNHWRYATEAEAMLVLEDLKGAAKLYRQAIEKTSSQREIESIYGQAARVADRVFGEKGLKQFEELSGFASAAGKP